MRAANAGAAAPGRTGSEDDLDAGEMQPRDAGKPVQQQQQQPTQPQQPTQQPKPDQQPQQPQQPPIDASMPQPSSRCRPGVYTGSFTGSLQLIGVSLGSVTGTVRARLELDVDGDYMHFHDGHVVGVDTDGNMLSCDIAGRVNCDNFQLEEGRLEDGNFHNLGANSDTPFTGTVQATYSEEPHSVVGTWQVEATDAAYFGGRGTWSLVLGP